MSSHHHDASTDGAHASRAARPHVVVVGGGISGLATAEALLRGAPDVHVTVLDAAPRLGGIVGTERADGFVMERGPDVFLAAKQATQELAGRVGVAERMTGTNPAVRGAYVMRAGRLHRVPDGLTGLVPSRLAPIAATGLLSWRGKLRLAAEPLVRAREDDGDESVASFVARRMGREAYARLVEPLLAGIYAGDAAQLSIDATFPQLRAMEREHGGLLRGVARQRAGGEPAPAGDVREFAPRSGFLSFRTGMQELVDALEAALERSGRVTLRRDARVRAATVAPPAVLLDDDTRIAADAVVVATPAHEAARLLADVDDALAADLAAIEHGSAATVTVAVPRHAVRRPLDATGYVIPRAEGRAVLACTWSSTKFVDRAPAGWSLFRVFVGGVGREAVVERSDDALVSLARAELREIMGVDAAPRLTRVVRWMRAMPQYTLGHVPRVARIEARVAAIPGLALAGNAYRGVGIPDCIRSGERAAGAVLAHLGRGAALAAG